MAPIKFEEGLKDKIEKRAIEPSSSVWDALEKRIDNQEKKLKIAPFWWLGIAASFVGTLFVITMFFNNSNSENVTPIIVDIKKSENIQTKTLPAVEALVDNNEVLDNTKTEINTPKEVKSNTIASYTNPKTDANQEVLSLETMAAANKNEQIQHKEVQPLSIIDFENAKLTEVVSQINRLKLENNTISDAEINALLKHAEKEIFKNKLYNETTRTIDANALLQDVEADLEQTFRTKVFEALKSNYETVKTAVANRNN
jgi:hypothetical protein